MAIDPIKAVSATRAIKQKKPQAKGWGIFKLYHSCALAAGEIVFVILVL